MHSFRLIAVLGNVVLVQAITLANHIAREYRNDYGGRHDMEEVKGRIYDPDSQPLRDYNEWQNGKEKSDMLDVKFYDTVDDALLKFAVIISRSNGKWVFCKHKERDTYEAPGGHREAGEGILETARRELQEETGAVKFDMKPLCVYSVTGKTRVNETGEETFGLLCFAEIMEFSGRLDSEMEKVVLMDQLPSNWTYPLIQPKLIEKYLQIEKYL